MKTLVVLLFFLQNANNIYSDLLALTNWTIDCSDIPNYTGVLTLRSKKQVKCDQGWTIIMHMQLENHVSANRTWAEYEEGFGAPEGSHWRGLKHIAETMAGRNSWRLQFSVKVKKNKRQWSGIYNQFSLDAKDKYRLRVGDFSGKKKNNVLACTLNEYEDQNGMPFSTKDHDNDRSSGNCAKKWGGAFWYNDCGLLDQYDYTKRRVGVLRTCEKNTKNYFLRELTLEMRPN